AARRAALEVALLEVVSVELGEQAPEMRRHGLLHVQGALAAAPQVTRRAGYRGRRAAAAQRRCPVHQPLGDVGLLAAGDELELIAPRVLVAAYAQVAQHGVGGAARQA